MIEFPAINIGNAPNDGQGECLREGGKKINSNFVTVRDELLQKITGVQVTQIVALTRLEYEALETPNATTLYIITD